MVPHEHEGMDRNRFFGTAYSQQLSIVETIPVVAEYGTPIHPALDDVHGDTGEFQPGDAWRHGPSVIGKIPSRHQKKVATGPENGATPI